MREFDAAAPESGRRLQQSKTPNHNRNIFLLVTLMNLKFDRPYRLFVTNFRFGSLAVFGLT